MQNQMSLGVLLGLAVSFASGPVRAEQGTVLDELITRPCITSEGQRCYRLNQHTLAERVRLLGLLSHAQNEEQTEVVTEGFLQAPVGERRYIDEAVFYAAALSNHYQLKYLLADNAAPVLEPSRINASKVRTQRAIALFHSGTEAGKVLPLFRDIAADPAADADDRMLSVRVVYEFGERMAAISLIERMLQQYSAGEVITSQSDLYAHEPEQVSHLLNQLLARIKLDSLLES